MAHSRRHFLQGTAAFMAAGCAGPVSPLFSGDGAKAGGVDVFDPALLELIDPAEPLEVLGRGYGWSEGPAWDEARQRVYFTDVPGNTAYSWSRARGVDIFMQPSGAPAHEAEGFREPGANGLLIGRDGRLLICNHGRRAVEAMDIETGQRTMLATSFEGLAFNSPNDLVETSNGVIYFTDPPYGLEGLGASPLKQMPVNGVYRLSVDGVVTRTIDDMTLPNGIALSPDETYLYVSQSDPAAPLVRRISLKGTPTDEVLFDAAPYMKDGPGLPDGIAVAATGHLFVTGPGGIFILTPDGKSLGRIDPGRAAANCAFGEDGRTLFIAAHDRLMRMRTKVAGLAWR